MSDSDLSDAPSTTIPSDTAIEKDLRDQVRKAAKAHEEPSVKSIRTASEQSLDLPQGFYKGHEEWKGRSKTIIEAEYQTIKALKDEDGSPEPRAVPTKPKAPAKKKPVTKPQPKRTAPEETSRPRKKTKTKSYEEEDSDSPEELSPPPSDFSASSEEATSKKPQKKTATKDSKKQLPKPKAKPRPKPPASASSDLSDAESVASAPEDTPAQKEAESNSESEMSVVLDDAPPKKRSKSKDTSEPKSKAPKSKSNPSEEADPDKEEIKKLQGWLVKCGIRKVWGKELKPYETSKAKIKHLKEMLSEAGMTGRFSNEKAASIKEARELAADIEAVQEGAQRWGKSDEDDGDDNGAEDKTRSGRRIVRGAKNYAFLSSDGEETD